MKPSLKMDLAISGDSGNPAAHGCPPPPMKSDEILFAPTPDFTVVSVSHLTDAVKLPKLSMIA